jgi:hypothetical protein
MNHEIGAMFNTSALPLRIPLELRDRVHRYVRQHQGSALVAEQAPFRRQLDFWTAAIAVACAKGLQPRPGSSTTWGEKFVDTRAVQIDPRVADLLVVLAAGEYGIADERLSDPAEVIELANRYAAAGAPTVLNWLEDPNLRQTQVEKVLAGLKESRRAAAATVGLTLTSQDLQGEIPRAASS